MPVLNILPVIAAMFSQPAGLPAYLDPGSGSFVIQLLIGAVVGLIVALKAYWSRIQGFIGRSPKQTPAGPAAREGDDLHDVD